MKEETETALEHAIIALLRKLNDKATITKKEMQEAAYGYGLTTWITPNNELILKVKKREDGNN